MCCHLTYTYYPSYPYSYHYPYWYPWSPHWYPWGPPVIIVPEDTAPPKKRQFNPSPNRSAPLKVLNGNSKNQINPDESR